MSTLLYYIRKAYGINEMDYLILGNRERGVMNLMTILNLSTTILGAASIYLVIRAFSNSVVFAIILSLLFTILSYAVTTYKLKTKETQPWMNLLPSYEFEELNANQHDLETEIEDLLINKLIQPIDKDLYQKSEKEYWAKVKSEICLRTSIIMVAKFLSSSPNLNFRRIKSHTGQG